ncbi:MAG: putative transposase [Gammaproteobacteria bacterium]
MLSRKRAEFGALNSEGEIEPLEVEMFERRKAELHESFATLQEEVAALEAQRKATQRHIPFHDLPEEERFKRSSTQSKVSTSSIPSR